MKILVFKHQIEFSLPKGNPIKWSISEEICSRLNMHLFVDCHAVQGGDECHSLLKFWVSDTFLMIN